MKKILALSLLVVAGSAFAQPVLKKCTGVEGAQSITIEFPEPWTLAEGSESKFALEFIESAPNTFGFQIAMKGVAVVKMSYPIRQTIKFANETGNWQAEMVLQGNSGRGVITYNDFLEQPTDPQAPPIQRRISISCTAE